MEMLRSAKPLAWFAQMQAAFSVARFSESIHIFEEAARSGSRTSCDSQLLYARSLLKKDSQRAGAFLSKLELSNPTLSQASYRHLYLGTAFARLRDFSEADAQFAMARSGFTKTHEQAEFAMHLTRRYLLSNDLTAAVEWYQQTLSDQTRKGKIRSTHLHAIMLGHSEQYETQGQELLKLLTLIGSDYKPFAEDWYVAVHTLSILARELPIPAFATRAHEQLEIATQWSEDFAVHRFQALKALAWCRALQGDQLGCMRYLRQAQVVAPSDVWKAIVALDRAFFALVMNQRPWAENEFALAEDFSDVMDWEATTGEERVALLLLAELAADLKPKRAKYYLARYQNLGRLKSNLHQFSFDHRLEAMSAFTAGTVHAAAGEPAKAEESFRSAWRVFDSIGYNVRAGRSAASIYRLTGQSRWRYLAEDKFAVYPHSALVRDIPRLASSKDSEAFFTPTQTEVVNLIRRGLSTKEIANELGRSQYTVFNHLKIVYRKLGVKSRAGMLAEIQRRGILS